MQRLKAKAIMEAADEISGCRKRWSTSPGRREADLSNRSGAIDGCYHLGVRNLRLPEGKLPSPTRLWIRKPDPKCCEKTHSIVGIGNFFHPSDNMGQRDNNNERAITVLNARNIAGFCNSRRMDMPKIAQMETLGKFTTTKANTTMATEMA